MKKINSLKVRYAENDFETEMMVVLSLTLLTFAGLAFALWELLGFLTK